MRSVIGPVGGAAIAAAAALFAPPLAAQVAAGPVTPTPTPREGTVGPEELRGFSLPGTVIRPAQPPAPAATPPASGTTPSTRADPPPPAANSRREPGRTATTSSPSAGPTQPDPLSLPPTLAPPATGTGTDGLGSQPGFAGPIAMPTEPVATDDVPPAWPWLLAALLLAGLSGFAFWRQRSARRPFHSGAEGALAFRGPEPQPATRPIPPRRAPELSPSGGVVSTRLRPWIDYEFVPERAVVTDEGVVLHFELALINSGNAPARDVRVEARLINAGAEQNQEIAAFFERSLGAVEAIDSIAPLGRVLLRSSAVMPRDSLREFVMEGRRLFVPLVAFNGQYRWNGGTGQGATAFLVGRGGEDDAKLGPLRLDLGPRLFRGLAARRLPLGIRR